MQRAAIHDLETLRERLKAALDQAPGSAKGVVQTGSELTRPRRASPAATGIDGQEVTNDLGRFVLQEHVFDYRATHGTFPLDHLLSMPAQWIGDVSQGRADPAAVDRWAYLDTETTGLAGGTGTCAFLVGVGSVEESGFRVRLFFMRDYDEEGAMLHGLARHLARFDVLFTYNGKSFDVPLLETRYRMQRQRNPLAALGHVDLLHPARRLWSARMPNCRLATLEAAILGFARHGDIPGSLIPQRYFDFLRTRHGAPLGPVFHHNVRDILSLACLGSVVMSSYSDPDNAPLRHGLDIMGLASWLGKDRRDKAALCLYRKAVRAGLPSSALELCLLEAARIERRAGNHAAKVELLQDLSRIGGDHCVTALEWLAKHYEHIARDFARALEHTWAAQQHGESDELSHREGRLLRRIAADRARASRRAVSADPT